MSTHELIQGNLHLAHNAAYRIKGRLPCHITPDDLVSFGYMGLVQAAGRFNPTRSNSFKTFATRRIEGAILDGLRALDPVSRDMRRHFKEVAAATDRLTQELARRPTEAEIAKALGLTVSKLRRRQSQFSRAGLHASEGANPRSREPQGTFPTGYDLVLRGEAHETLMAAIATLPPRSQTMLRLYYASELTMKEIGEHLGVNESRVSQIHARTIALLRSQLEGKI